MEKKTKPSPTAKMCLKYLRETLKRNYEALGRDPNIHGSFKEYELTLSGKNHLHALPEQGNEKGA